MSGIEPIKQTTMPSLRLLGTEKHIRAKTDADILSIKYEFLKLFASLRRHRIVLDDPVLVKLSGFDPERDDNAVFFSFIVADSFSRPPAGFVLYSLPASRALVCHYDGAYERLPETYARLRERSGELPKGSYLTFIDRFSIGSDLVAVLSGKVFVALVALERPVETYAMR